MADTPIEQREPGAPVARGEIDPDLVKLARSQPRVGLVTAAGVMFLCLWFLLRLGPDRTFAGAGAPAPVTVADVVAGKVETERFVKLPAEPLIAHAVRATNAKAALGMRVVPVRGTADQLWIAASGDGWEPPSIDGYVGRLRKLDELPFADAVRAWVAGHPAPVFASVAAIRAGAQANQVATVAGDPVTLAAGDKVAVDTTEPSAATIVATFNDRLPDTAAWNDALGKAGVTTAQPGKPDDALGQVRYAVALPVDHVTKLLEAAGLWAARVDPVARHVETTWGELRGRVLAGQPGFGVPDAQLDLVGLYVARPIPPGAYVVVTGELPDDYWYVLPVTIALAVIFLLFAWAFVRAIRRDLLPTRAA
ncbi:MAG TPA: hypothetical protein VFP84_40560 [Kofleriaceae bacterium]|nr:hypothetical protein [Kofleriaceae bacterium]